MIATAVPARQAYRRLAPGYDSNINPLLALEQRLLLSLLPLIDVGAGTGRWSRYCKSQGAKVLALDLCPEMLLYAPKPAAVADARKLPLPDKCADVVICAFTFGYAPFCLGELARIAHPGGVIIITDMHPDAIQRGWKRSFKVGAESIDVAHEPYQLADLRHPQLKFASLREPSFGAQERPLFEQAGRSEAFEECSRYPAIFIATWIKVDA